VHAHAEPSGKNYSPRMHLLDTNICIYYIRGRYDLRAKVRAVGLSDCLISEVTVAELKFGVEKESSREA